MKLKSENASNSIAIKRIIKKYYEYIYANKCDNLNVMKKFLKNRVSEQLKNLKL